MVKIVKFLHVILIYSVKYIIPRYIIILENTSWTRVKKRKWYNYKQDQDMTPQTLMSYHKKIKFLICSLQKSGFNYFVIYCAHGILII